MIVQFVAATTKRTSSVRLANLANTSNILPNTVQAMFTSNRLTTIVFYKIQFAMQTRRSVEI